MKPTIGRIVHVIVKKQETFKVIPAIIVNVWTDTCINVKVFHDGTNSSNDYYKCSFEEWLTSINLDETENPQPNTWHWPPKV